MREKKRRRQKRDSNIYAIVTILDNPTINECDIKTIKNVVIVALMFF